MDNLTEVVDVTPVLEERFKGGVRTGAGAVWKHWSNPLLRDEQLISLTLVVAHRAVLADESSVDEDHSITAAITNPTNKTTTAAMRIPTATQKPYSVALIDLGGAMLSRGEGPQGS